VTLTGAPTHDLRKELPGWAREFVTCGGHPCY
jgi:hypothetical protein